MSMILSWVLFPLVLAALGLGWGALIEWGAGVREGALTIALGLAAAIVVAALLTQFSPTAPAAGPVCAAGGALGLVRAWRHTRLAAAAALAAVGVIAIYGAPVILSGQATFLGYVRLDDTATWLAFTDQFFAHGRSLSTLEPSTYRLLLSTNIGTGYPAGAFMLLGVGHWITGIDVAWIFQPYEAVCAGALALCCFDLLAPVAPSAWLRGFAAFIAAQSALLFGYAAWGGVKEMTGAFLIALGVAVAVRLLRDERPSARATLPLAVAGAALIVTLGAGAVIYVGPALLAVAAIVAWRAIRQGRSPLPYLAAIPLAGAMALPAWLTLKAYLDANNGYGSCSPVTAANHADCYGNLITPLRALQVAGIWLYGDFRDSPGAPPGFANHLLVWCVIGAAAFALAWTLWHRELGVALYVGVALIALAALAIEGTAPWLMGKTLAMSSPAVLLAGLAGGAILFSRRALVPAGLGVLLVGAIAGGVLWSNYLQYHNVTLAPRQRLADLQTIGSMVVGHGPTFLNEYEIYGDRHFLRGGAPVEPAEYRGPLLPTLDNAVLTKSAWANIDSFGLGTLAPYRSLVLRVGPTESLPPSLYQLVWAGRYYQLWRQPARPRLQVISHTPLGDSQSDAYCGEAENVPSPNPNPLCPIMPASVPACSQVLGLARTAATDGAELRAYARANPIVLRGTDTQWGPGWSADPVGQTLTATAAGATAVAHVNIPFGVRGYQLWLGGSFDRGFQVSVDERPIGAVADHLEPIGGYEPVGAPLTLAPGTHTITIVYPGSNLSPGNADSENYTTLNEIALSPPLYPAARAGRMLMVAPQAARSLCGRTLDWIEVVKPV